MQETSEVAEAAKAKVDNQEEKIKILKEKLAQSKESLLQAKEKKHKSKSTKKKIIHEFENQIKERDETVEKFQYLITDKETANEELAKGLKRAQETIESLRDTVTLQEAEIESKEEKLHSGALEISIEEVRKEVIAKEAKIWHLEAELSKMRVERKQHDAEDMKQFEDVQCANQLNALKAKLKRMKERLWKEQTKFFNDERINKVESEVLRIEQKIRAQSK